MNLIAARLSPQVVRLFKPALRVQLVGLSQSGFVGRRFSSTSNCLLENCSHHHHHPTIRHTSTIGAKEVKTVPKVCRAAPVINFGTPEYKLVPTEEYPVPEPGEGELLVEIKASGVCQSDHHFVYGDWGLEEVPGVDCMGHEGAGVVAKLGPGVTKWKVGDRVGVLPIISTCGKCEYCTGGHESLCVDAVLTAVHWNGTFCQYMITKADYTCRLPDNVTFSQAAPFMCSGGTAFSAMKSAAQKPGNYVVIMGAAGGVGHMAVQFSKALGQRPIALDVGESKRATAMECGAEHYIDVGATKDLPAAIKAVTDGRGAHAVIVCAGSGKAYAQAADLLRPLGVVVAVGLPPQGTAIAGAEPRTICFGALSIRGILVSTRDEMEEALTYLAKGQVSEHITERPFSDFPAALAEVAASKTTGRSVIMFDQ